MSKHIFVLLGVLLLVGVGEAAVACTVDEPIGDLSKHVRLNEIAPNPISGEEEFIELYNDSDTAVNLTGWSLADASGKTYTISSDDFVSVTIKKHGYFVVPQSVSKIYLNNSGDSVTMYQPDDSQRDSTTYETSDSGQVWAFTGTDWAWSSTATDGEDNIITSGNTEDEADSDTETDSSQWQTSDALRISELLPNPAGLDSTDEWIELHNTGATTVNLTGWQLTDSASYYTIDGVSIAAAEYMVFEVGDTGINLNNTGDEIFLIDPYETIIDGVEYGSATEGQSWARFDTGWSWTESPSPAEANVLITNDDTTSADETTDDTDTSETDTINIELFRSLDDGSSATLNGVVTVLPNIFGSQYFYIQDDNAGIQVYSYNKDFPELAVGDLVNVTGEKSTSRGETRIKITTANDIMVQASDQPIIARDTGSLDEALEGLLVQVEGSLTDIDSGGGFIDDAIELVFKDNAAITHGDYSEGAGTTAIGIVSQYDDNYRLLPRSNDDLVQADTSSVALVDSANAATGTTSYTLDESNTQSANTLLMIVLSGIAVLAIAIGLQKGLSRRAAKSATHASKTSSSVDVAAFLAKKNGAGNDPV